MSEQPDLSAIVAEITEGDPDAMQALYDLYATQLFRFCLFRIGDPEAAQDVLQEVFVQAWHGLRKFEYRGEAAFVAWLHKIANNAVINHVRKRKRQPSISLSLYSDWPQLHGPDIARSVCERLELRQAVKRLSPDQQHVVALRYFAGLSNGETALVLGRTEGAIKALHHRALLRLHRLLTADAGAGERLVLAAA